MKDAGQVIPKELQLYAPTKKTFDSSSEEEDSDEEWGRGWGSLSGWRRRCGNC